MNPTFRMNLTFWTYRSFWKKGYNNIKKIIVQYNENNNTMNILNIICLFLFILVNLNEIYYGNN